MTKWKKHTLLGLLVITGLVSGYASFAYLATPEPGPTQTNFERLHVGSSLQQVEAALGPADEKDDSFGVCVWFCNRHDPVSGVIAIRFSSDGRAQNGFANFGHEPQDLRPPFSLLDTVKALLHL
jgi:hypothetical protein